MFLVDPLAAENYTPEQINELEEAMARLLANYVAFGTPSEDA